MGSYIILSKLNSSRVKTVRDRPEAVQGIADEVAALDGKVVAQYALLGDSDFCTIVSLPDNAAAHLLTGQSPIGTTRTILPAIDMPLFVRLLGQTTETAGPHAWQVKWWARALRPLAFWYSTGRKMRGYMQPYAVLGQEHLRDFKGPAIFIANHASHMDMPALYYALPRRFRSRVATGGAADRWFIKGRKGMTNKPWYASLSGTFPIARGGGSAALDYPKWLIDQGQSIIIFPEGTRSRSGKMSRFKHGPSILAVSKGVPVVPLYLQGTRNIRATGSREMTPGPVTVLIGEPLRFPADAQIADVTRALFHAVDGLRLQAESHQPSHAEEVPEAPELVRAG